MKMTKKMMAVMAILTLGTSMAQAQAMGGVGNGGGTHWCPDKAPEMYDVYEGVRRYKLDIVENGSRSEEIIEKAVQRVTNSNATLAHELNEKIKYLMNGGLSLEDGIELKRIPDANVLMVDEGCEYRQLANWDNVTNRVFVNNDYYQSMSELNKAALILHEAVYAVSRDRLKVDNSDSSRKLVAELLASTFPSTSLKGLLSDKDVLTKDRDEGVTLIQPSDAAWTPSHTSLAVHVRDLNLAPLKSFGKLFIRVPQIVKAHKDLEKITNQLNRNNLSRRERKSLQESKRKAENKISSYRTRILLNGLELIKGVGVVDLEKQMIVLTGVASSSETETETIDLDLNFYLNDGDKRKTLKYTQELELPDLSIGYRSRVHKFKFEFSQNRQKI
jgi:hypothetical protein